MHATQQIYCKDPECCQQYLPKHCLRCYQEPHRSVLMAVANGGSKRVSQTFEEAEEFLLYEACCHEIRFIGRCHVHANDMQQRIRLLDGCEVVLCRQIGEQACSALQQAQIEPNSQHPLEQIEDAIQQVYQHMVAAGRLAEQFVRPLFQQQALSS